jgi:hypothetical protein
MDDDDDDYLGFCIYEWSGNDLIEALNNKRHPKMVLALMHSRPELIQQPAEGSISLPIHVACNRGASLEVIKKLISVYPEGLACQSVEHHVDLPVVMACRQRKSSLKIIKFLVEAFPECLQGTNDRAPLFHYCCGIGKSDKWRRILDYVASKDPEVTHTPDFEGLYPIHHLARGKSVEVLNL